MNRVPPELISLDNVMEDFMAQSKRKNTLVVIKSFPQQRTWENGIVPLAADANPPSTDEPQPKRKPWKLKALIALGLMLWFWWLVCEYILRMVR